MREQMHLCKRIARVYAICQCADSYDEFCKYACFCGVCLEVCFNCMTAFVMRSSFVHCIVDWMVNVNCNT